MDTKDLANDILSSIQFAVDAHIHHPNSDSDSVRFWDMKTPYVIHPTWCAMTILTETTLSEKIRFTGYKALLWHDVLEDTSLKLPLETPLEVVNLVREMTFSSFTEEQVLIWDKPIEIRLLKLYDKVSNLLDGKWMKVGKWNRYSAFTARLMEDVHKNYGELNIVKIANAICEQR